MPRPQQPGAPVTSLAAHGDDAALARLVRDYHDRVVRFGTRVCRDAADADDAVQEAFIKLARRQDVITHPSALSWLFTVVRNACRRLLRPFAREQRALGTRVADDGQIASQQPTAQEALERWELVEQIHAAIRALPAMYREVIVLRDLEGQSGEEACAALGIDLATMKTRLHRARARLREALVAARELRR